MLQGLTSGSNGDGALRGAVTRSNRSGIAGAWGTRASIRTVSGLALALVALAGPARADPLPLDIAETALAERLAGSDRTPLRVVYLLDRPSVVDPRPEGRHRAEELEALQARLAEARRPLMARLRTAGHEIVYESSFGGVVVAVAPPSAIRAAARDPDIAEAFFERRHRSRLNISTVVTQASVVNGRGVLGDGARVAIVEEGRVGPHANLPTAGRILCRPTRSSVVSEHKTQIAGIIQSTSATRPGVARRATLIDAVARDLTDSEVIAATDCAIAQGAVAINMSFGSDTDGAFDAFASYVDRVVYNTGVAIVVAVSNTCEFRMGSPEIAYNDISVGAFSDRNTAALTDDRHACDPRLGLPFSAFRNPPSQHGDREQPDLVAPGFAIRTTLPFGGFADAYGTSFAAPHVVAGIALLDDRATSSLVGQAERIRAILMASARHNIEGASRLSDRDGAGAIRLAAADALLRNGNSWSLTKPGGAAGFPHTQEFQATAGERVRVVLVWAHKPGRGNRTVSTDLNLTVANPVGAVVGVSQSRDNNFEIVEFVAQRTGTHRVRVTNLRPSAGRERLGLAVSTSDF